jgi:hypothetical protein
MDIDMEILKQFKEKQRPMQQKKITNNTMIITFEPAGGALNVKFGIYMCQMIIFRGY